MRKITRKLPGGISLDYYDYLRMRSLDHGTIILSQDVTETAADEILLALHELERRSHKDLFIIINSAGGEVFAGLAIYDALMNFKRHGGKIVTQAQGYAASMGAIILQAGDERRIARNSKLLIHEVSEFTYGNKTASDVQDERNELVKVNRQLASILAKRSGNSLTRVLGMIKKKDYWMTAEEALKLNFVDKIIA